MAKNKYKIAVFTSGPPRYVNLVTERLNRVLSDVDWDVFIHLWKIDTGNKIRANSIFDYTKLVDNPKVKVIMVQNPYDDTVYKKRIGTKINTHSPTFAIMGMFLGVNFLSNFLELLPDYNSYTHILRLRTDCAILNDNFLNLLDFDKKVVTVSECYHIPSVWISDQIMFSTVENFYYLWKFKDMNDIYDAFKKGLRNPEKTLEWRFTRDKSKKLRLNPSIIQYKDFQNVYSPPKAGEPEWVNKLIEAKKFRQLFLEPQKYYNSEQVEKHLSSLKRARPNNRGNFLFAFSNTRFIKPLAKAKGALSRRYSR